jgi:hypothetical protein
MRGYFLVFMTINHLSFQHGLAIAKLNHAELGFVQDAQGFIFLSGLIVGLTYAPMVAANSLLAAAKLCRRAGTLYAYGLAVLAAVLALTALVPQSRQPWGVLLGSMSGGWRFVARILDRLFRVPWLVFLGRHSLQVYAFHVLLVYLLAFADWQVGGVPEPARSLAAIAAVLTLSIPAAIHAHMVSRSRRPAARSPGPSGRAEPGPAAPAGLARYM